MVCGRGLPPENEGGLCMACAALLEEQALEQAETEREERRPSAEGLAYVRAAYPYDGVARRLILALKFEGMRGAAEPLAETMAGLRTGGEELVVPVPTTRRRLRERGYNQAALLAQAVARRRGLPCAQALTREDSRAAQMTLPASGRAKNVEGCMRADERVLGKRILLVDSSKFSRVSPAFFGTWSSIDAVITDVGVPEEWKTFLREQNITLEIAEQERASI